MGKHSKEDETKRINKKYLIILPIIIILALIVVLILTLLNNLGNNKFKSITESTTVEGEVLVFKSNNEYNKILEYTFENNILKKVKMYERMENQEDFNTKKESYEKRTDITILNIDEENLSIEIEKKDFGSDEGMSYEEIYDKYLVQIIGAYSQI